MDLKRAKHDVMKILAGAGVPCGACLDTGEVLSDPHLLARDMIVEVEHPVRGRYVTVGNPDQALGLTDEDHAGPAARRASAGGPARAGLRRGGHRRAQGGRRDLIDS